MVKPYTEFDLSAQLVEDRTWRIKELSDLQNAILRSDAIAQSVLLRALVAICYAHWEGYVRFAARKYLEHVALRKLSLSTLTPQFLKNVFLPRMATFVGSKPSVLERCAFIDEVLGAKEKRYSHVNLDLINTNSNLNFATFSDICTVCGVAIPPFASKSDFIDVILLKRRNAIAHGEETFVAIADVQMLLENTIELIRSFGDALENQAVLKAYRLATP
jgi:hypothetical protein